MRGRVLGLLVATLLGLAGCHGTEVKRPPKPPEDYTPPPEQEARFSRPPEYPKELLNKDNLISPKDSTVPAMGSPGSPGNPGSSHITPGRTY
jgi:hypothetical protein